MFGTDGSTNDNGAMQSADPQAVATPVDNTAVPAGFDAANYGQPADVGADASVVEPQAQTMPEPVSQNPSMTPMDNGGDLADIKQQALQQLSPLVGHLDQTPEEKFRTTMMMIQASDNSELIKDAYAAAQQIGDEKARAQALLDVINEINYFTQHHDQQSQ